MSRLIALLFAVLILAACDAGAPAATAIPAPPTEQVFNPAVDGTQWDRSPSNVVFRIDVTGGTPEDEFDLRNEVPLCTIYGDNTVVWTNEIGPFNVQVLYDRLEDAPIRSFADYLILSEKLYDWKERAYLQVPSAVEPVVETIYLNVNGTPHTTDGFAGWSFDYFLRILDSCRNLSIAPVIYEPEAAWMSAKALEYNPNTPVVSWDAEASGLSLAVLAASGERRWSNENNIKVLWNIMRTSVPNIAFLEGDQQFKVAIEVPNINRDAPPAPAQ